MSAVAQLVVEVGFDFLFELSFLVAVSSQCVSVAQLLSEVGLDFFFVLGFVFVLGFLIVVGLLTVLDLFCLGSVEILVVVRSAARAVAVSPLFSFSLVLSSLRIEDRG